MNYMTKEELVNVVGGASITGSMLSAIIKGINSLLDLGRSLGSAIRRLRNNTICPL
jgi:hypothetical protein